MQTRQFVINNYSNTLPPTVPIPFEITKAKFKKKLHAIADVKLFNGDIGEIAVCITAMGITTVEWLKLDKDIYWDGLYWREVFVNAS